MKFLPGGCRVFPPTEGESIERGTWSSRTLICRARGARDIAESIHEYGAGLSPSVLNPRGEEVFYVVSGSGRCQIGEFSYALEPGLGVYLPPAAAFRVENPGPEKLVLVSVCCPEDEGRRIAEEAGSLPAGSGEAPQRTVREQDRLPIPVADRQFKLLVNEDIGCRQVTQFIGFIPPSKAPFHYHTYEEAIYILEGTGIVYVEEGSAPFEPGTSIYLPVGLRHCLENPGPDPVRLLGVFYPSGSPAVAYES